MFTDDNKENYNFAPPPSYQAESKWIKLKRKINYLFVKTIAGTPFQFKVYPSYWHYKFNERIKCTPDVETTHFLYLKPNYGAGIGHQLANWNAGFYFAEFYGLRFAHYPFSNGKWETFLGFGENEVLVSELEKENFKTVILPKFNSENKEEVGLIGNIIHSYGKPNVLFSLEMDQGYMRQYDTAPILSQKFFAAAARITDSLFFKADSYNVAIHIRRRMAIETEEVWKSRGLDNSYYAAVLKQILAVMPKSKKVTVYLFSQGVKEDFQEFNDFDLIYCMDVGPVESFLHMVYADILVTSKSSFSYKPALLSKGIKICPKTFWHGYPETNDFILSDNDGNFDVDRLYALMDGSQIEGGANKNLDNAR